MRYLKEVELIAGHIGRLCDSTVNHDEEENTSQSSISKPSNTSTSLRIESEKEYELFEIKHVLIIKRIL